MSFLLGVIVGEICAGALIMGLLAAAGDEDDRWGA